MKHTLPPPSAPRVLYVFDLSCWVHRYWATMKGACARGFVSFVRRVLEERGVANALIACDPLGGNFRHDLAPEVYKASRAAKEAGLVARLQWARELADDLLGVRSVLCKNYEADDTMAAIVARARALEWRVVLLALDKDMMQLVEEDDSVVLWDGREGVIGWTDVLRKFDVAPNRLGDYLALSGDAADGVPGVPGIGPKSAVALINEYESIDAMLRAALDSRAYGFMRENPRMRSLLREHAEQAALCKRLVTLASDAPIPDNWLELSEVPR